MSDFLQTLSRRRSNRDFALEPITSSDLEAVLWAMYGVTDESGKRTVPSAESLHPLKLFLSVGHVEGLDRGLFEVDMVEQTFTRRSRRDLRLGLEQAALGEQPWVGSAAAVVTVCGNIPLACRHFVDQPPYGVRGERYVYLEAGASAQNGQLAATANGLASVLVAGFRDEITSECLGLKAPWSPILHLCLGEPESE
ncbi:SagB/ThcOx family dehydrogenase [Coralliovum pocilloporae]|uniref:SagB/ThcOx family dehydrogenase n=1 Tax=Coralliovum pocilloporae TaxID=3066369 RepID=UPI003306D6D7